jgi:hypothetical protein
MIGYVMLGTNDIIKARTLWDPIAEMLSAKVVDAYTNETRVWYGSAPGAPLLCITGPHNGEPATAGNGTMIAIPVTDTNLCHTIHAKALELGATSEGEPGPRGPGFYGSYFRDFDGNKICIFKAG